MCAILYGVERLGHLEVPCAVVRPSLYALPPVVWLQLGIVYEPYEKTIYYINIFFLLDAGDEFPYDILPLIVLIAVPVRVHRLQDHLPRIPRHIEDIIERGIEQVKTDIVHHVLWLSIGHAVRVVVQCIVDMIHIGVLNAVRNVCPIVCIELFIERIEFVEECLEVIHFYVPVDELSS